MAYQSWSVVFGEQPSASKWGILGTNDASFNDGTGIFGLYKNLLAVDSNPYKFSVYRTAAFNSTGAFSLVQHDTELFDTNGNFDITTNKGRYTVPVSGFYWVSAQAGNSTGTAGQSSAIYKNGSQIIQGNNIIPGGAGVLIDVNGLLQLTAGDYIEHYFLGGNGTAVYVSQQWCRFAGFLVSRT